MLPVRKQCLQERRRCVSRCTECTHTLRDLCRGLGTLGHGIKGGLACTQEWEVLSGWSWETANQIWLTGCEPWIGGTGAPGCSILPLLSRTHLLGLKYEQ